MNTSQTEARKQLQEELRARRGIMKSLPNRGESKEGYSFTEVEGVSVIIGLRGAYQLPAVRTYPETSRPGETALDAAVDADEHWKRQVKRQNYETGHFGPIVDAKWKCKDSECPCRQETYDQRLSRSVKGKKKRLSW